MYYWDTLNAHSYTLVYGQYSCRADKQKSELIGRAEIKYATFLQQTAGGAGLPLINERIKQSKVCLDVWVGIEVWVGLSLSLSLSLSLAFVLVSRNIQLVIIM